MTGVGIGISNCQGIVCQVQYGCDSGWTLPKYLSPRLSELYRVVGVSPNDPEGLNVRSGPHTTFPSVGSIPYNAIDVIRHVCQPGPIDRLEWCLVTYRNVSGWAAGRLLQPASAAPFVAGVPYVPQAPPPAAIQRPPPFVPPAAVVAAPPPPAPAPIVVAAPTPVPVPSVGKRVALVIGNGAYQTMPRLPNPVNDATDMSKALETLGFSVVLGTDLKRNDMEDKLIAFAKAARSADAALVFYAGHGLQYQGINYLVPTDARLTDEADLLRLVKVQSLIENLSGAKGARILILDACRDNEVIKQLAANLPKSRGAAFRGGLAEEKADGLMIVFSTQPDTLASDGEGRNSPFTAAMLKYLPTPGVDARVAFTRVRSEVLRATGGTQRPELSDSLDGEFQFEPK
jgi:hypothetical protein